MSKPGLEPRGRIPGEEGWAACPHAAAGPARTPPGSCVRCERLGLPFKARPAAVGEQVPQGQLGVGSGRCPSTHFRVEVTEALGAGEAHPESQSWKAALLAFDPRTRFTVLLGALMQVCVCHSPPSLSPVSPLLPPGCRERSLRKAAASGAGSGRLRGNKSVIRRPAVTVDCACMPRPGAVDLEALAVRTPKGLCLGGGGGQVGTGHGVRKWGSWPLGAVSRAPHGGCIQKAVSGLSHSCCSCFLPGERDVKDFLCPPSSQKWSRKARAVCF